MSGLQEVNLQTTITDLSQESPAHQQFTGGDGQQKGSTVSIMTIAIIALVALVILMILYGAFEDVFAGCFWTFASVGSLVAIIMIVLAGLQMSGRSNLLEQYVK